MQATERTVRRPSALLDQRVAMHWASRSWTRVGIGLVARHDRRWAPGSLALVIGGLAYDQWLRRWLAADRRPHLVLRTAMDVIDVGLWSHVDRSHADQQQNLMAMVVLPDAVEHAMRATCGAEAVPVVDPLRPFPPPAGHRLRAITTTLAPIALPLASIHLVRARQGRRLPLRNYRYVTLGLLSGALIGRHRDLAQAEARQRWATRAADVITEERRAAQAQAATRSSMGHDFKKVLTALAVAGSVPARRAAHAQIAHPGTVTAEAEGTTLWRAAWGVEIEPPSNRDLWISRQQAQHLERFIDEVDEAGDGVTSRRPVVVESVDGPEIRVSYHGRQLALRNPRPEMEARLDPLAVALAATAISMIAPLVAVHGAPRTRWALATTGIAFSASIRQRGRDHDFDGRSVRSAIFIGTASTVLYYLATIADPRPVRRSGPGIVAPAPGAVGSLLVLSQRHRIGTPTASLLTAAIIASWAAAAKAHGQERSDLLGGAIVLGQAIHSTFGIHDAVVAEAAQLEELLQEQFSRQVAEARRTAAVAELDRFREQVDLARRELDRLGDTVDPALAGFISRECMEVSAWIEAQEASVALGS